MESLDMQKLKQIDRTVKEANEESFSLNPSSIRSRNQIIVALFELAKNESIAKISISQICAQASITRPTFYHHFKTKEDVVVFVLDELFAEYIAAIKTTIKKDEAPIALQVVVTSFISFWSTQKHFLQSVWSSNFFGLMGERFKDYLDEIYVLYNMPHNSKPKRLEETEQRYHNAFLANGLAAILLEWTAYGFRESEDELAGYISSLFKSLHMSESD